MVQPDTPLPDDHPASGKGQIDGRATAYVCHGQVCSPPALTPERLREALQVPASRP
jgi:uncharacterized protein YyaL (SSP411 family)